MRPFSTLGVVPFLASTTDDQRALQLRFHELSRDLHPDRLGSDLSDEERDAAESRAAELNRDYAILKDFWKLVEHVAGEGAPPAGRSTPPPELAMEYFELQELLAERGPQDPEVNAKALEIATSLRAKLEADEAQVKTITAPFGYQGSGDSRQIPWSEADLIELRAALTAVRFDRSFLRDLETKFRA